MARLEEQEDWAEKQASRYGAGIKWQPWYSRQEKNIRNPWLPLEAPWMGQTVSIFSAVELKDQKSPCHCNSTHAMQKLPFSASSSFLHRWQSCSDILVTWPTPTPHPHSELTTDHSKLTIGHSKLTTDHSKLTTDHSKLTTGQSKLTTGHSKLTTGHSKLTTSYFKLTTSHSKPTTNHSKLTTGHSKLTTSHSKLTTDHSKLTTDHSKLTTGCSNWPQAPLSWGFMKHVFTQFQCNNFYVQVDHVQKVLTMMGQYSDRVWSCAQ